MTRNEAIRKKCLECSGGSPKEVTICHHFDCPLWWYRCGSPPTSKAYKERMKTAKKNYSPDFAVLKELGIRLKQFDGTAYS